MSENKASVGNREIGTKSDCYVEMELLSSGGIQLELKSKVASLFGKSITKLVNDILAFYKVDNAHIYLEDKGAVDFVLAARIEAAIRQLKKTDKEYLLPQLKENKLPTKKDIFRISRLYLPGNTPKLMLNAGIHKPNGLILDLEDAVSPNKKYEARFIVRNALRNLNFYGAERMVRINQGDMGLEDLRFIVPHYANLILIPKCESKEDIIRVDDEIQKLKKQFSIENDIWLMPIIESAKGVLNAYDIASASKNISSMAIGLEDYTADLGVQRTDEATESFFARNMLVTAARAASIQAIDSVFSDVSNMEALALNVQKSKGLGFDGMGCIHPRQIRVIHENFAPTVKEIDKAKRIYLAFLEAKEKGLGVVSLGTKMIDAPVVKRAETTIRIAEETGILEKNWRSE
ncbi:MAG: citrate lyase ACP [Marinilabiliales bacterium]|nr:MAG: citrate lyase ACP [Marinilabiliales bacterium]